MSDRIHQEFASEIWLALAPALSALSRDKMFSLLVSNPVYCNQGGGTNGVKNVTAPEVQLTERALEREIRGCLLLGVLP